MKARARSFMRDARCVIVTTMCLALVVALALPTSVVAAPTWAPAVSGTGYNLSGVSTVSSSDAWAVGALGTILHYNGTSWSPQTSGTTNWLNAVDMVSATEGWAVGDGGTIRHYSGGAWSPQSSGTYSDLYAVSMLSATEGWAVGVGGTVLHYSGGAWTPQSTGTMMSLYGVSMVSPTEGWAVGWNTLLHYSGGAWSTQSLTPSPRSISMVSAEEGWLVGDGGMIKHYSNGAWEAQTSGTTSDLYGLTMISATEGWAVGGGVILHYSNGTWTPESDDFMFLRSVSMADATHGFAVGQSGTIAEYKDRTTSSGGVGVSADVEMALTFWIAPGASPQGGSVTESAIDFGSVIPETAKTGSHDLGVTCNSPTGYAVTSQEDRPLTFGTVTIPDATGDIGDITETNAGYWDSEFAYGFGYTLSNLYGSTPAEFTTGYKQFANVSAGETPQRIMSATGPVSQDAARVTYKLNCAGDQMAGAYSNVVTYVATANY